MNIKTITLAAFIATAPIAAFANRNDPTPEQIECAVDYMSSGEFAGVRNTHDLFDVAKATGGMNLALAATVCAMKDPSLSADMQGMEAMLPAFAMSAFEPPITALLKADVDKIPYIRLPRDRTLWIDTMKAWGEENPEEYAEFETYAKSLHDKK